jgi:hypothetical protein
MIPIAVRGFDGQWLEQESLLHSRITLLKKGRSGLEALTAVCSSVSETTGVPLIVGTIPVNTFLHYRIEDEATNERAREVLLRILGAMKQRMSWQLLCDPGVHMCALNIHSIQR